VPVTFSNLNTDCVSIPLREVYQEVIKQAIEASRPPSEQWAVTTHAQSESLVLQFDFARGLEAPRSLSYMPSGDNTQHSVLSQAACRFLRNYWPDGIMPQ
jgi:hypothetical protein